MTIRSISPPLWVALLCCATSGQNVLNSDQVFVVANAKRANVSAAYLGPASSNDRGDLVLHHRGANAQYQAVAFLREHQTTNNSSTAMTLVRHTGRHILGRTPTLNELRSVALTWRGSGAGRVWRVDFANGQFTAGTRIAEADVRIRAPFDLVSPVADLPDLALPLASVAFYGERGTDRSIYLAHQDVRTPLSATTLAGTRRGFASLDGYVAVSGNGNAVVRGTGASGNGVYAVLGGTISAVATPQTTTAFAQTGRRPSINDLGTVAFAGMRSGSPVEAWLFQTRGTGIARRAGSMGLLATSPILGEAPSSVSTIARTAINDLNQVACLGTDRNGKSALFTTSLGAMRKLLTVGDILDVAGTRYTITNLDLHDAINEWGQIALTAGVTDSTNQTDQLVLRLDRAPFQTRVSESPIHPSWQSAGTGYLLRSVPIARGGFATGRKTLSAVGCNLTSTTTVLSYFGLNVTPRLFQEWLVRSWELNDRLLGRRNNEYIQHSHLRTVNGQPRQIVDNDFRESIVERYSQLLAVFSGKDTYVRFAGIHKNESGRQSNLLRLIADLRLGRPAKLRVPNSRWATDARQRFGHFIVAYGLLDPSRPDAAIGLDQILVHDPGHRGIRHLADYAQRMGLTGNWFEDNRYVHNGRTRTGYRLYRYEPVALNLAPPPPLLHVSSLAPVEVLVRDASGRRAGSDPSGTYEEIPGSQAVSEPTYFSLDTMTTEPAWEGDHRHHVLVPAPAVGSYRVEVRGTATGSYAVVASTSSGASNQVAVFEGTIRTGQRIVHRLEIRPRGIRRIGRSTPSCNGSIVASANGSPTPGNSAFALTSAGGPPNASGALLIGAANPLGSPIAGILAHVDLAGPVVTLGLTTGPQGDVRVPIPLPSHLARGAEAGLQLVFANTGSCTGSGPFSATHGVELTVQ